MNHLLDPLLPLLIPIGHFDLAARQADDRRGPGGPGHSHGQVLNEGMEAFGHAAVAVDEVQHLIEQQQYRRLCGGEHFGQRLGSRRCGQRGGPERGDARIARQLASQIDPGRLPPRCRVPGVADEDPDTGSGSFRHPGIGQEIGYAGELGGVRASGGEVVKRGKGVRLAATELGD